jgi:predicted deacetylase
MIKKIKNYISNHTGMLIRFDDVAENMNWYLMGKCEELFKKYNIKPLLGVIPNNQDKELLVEKRNNEFWTKVRQWKSMGWEIAMHGYSHVYDSTAHKKKDYFKYGGGSEFYAHSFEEQKIRLQKGLKKFKDENIKIRAFFAPNHIYDENTFRALKSLGINQVIDGYGLFPYEEEGITFIPQLFYKNTFIPFGFQSTQIHLNYWKDQDFTKFKELIEKKHNKIITYDQMLHNIDNGSISYLLRIVTSKLLKLKRSIKNN